MLESFSFIKEAAEYVIVLGGAGSAIGWLIYHIYKMVRNVEKLVDSSERNEKEQQNMKDRLQSHIEMEENRDAIRDQQMLLITKELQPNGGSSMKDVLNCTAKKIDEVHTRVSVLEQWKEDHPDGAPKSPRKRK